MTLPTGWEFVLFNNLPMLSWVKNGRELFSMFLYGAHIWNWMGVLWQSPNSLFVPGYPIRGGVPVVAPWFGKGLRGEDYSYLHGPVRLQLWGIKGIRPAENGGWILDLELNSSALTMPEWPYKFGLYLTVLVNELTLFITLKYLGGDGADIGLHTYFAVNANTTFLDGLQNRVYENREGGPNPRTDSFQLRFHGDDEIDRLYEGMLTLTLGVGETKLQIQNRAPNTVVWRPSESRIPALQDIPHGASRQFVCIEPLALNSANGGSVSQLITRHR